MATSSTVSVKITGDASGFTKATQTATADMTNVQKNSSKTSAALEGNLKSAGQSFRGVGELAKGLGDAFGFPLDGIVDLSNTMRDLSKGAAETIAPAIEKLTGLFGSQKVATEEATTATEGATDAQEGLDAAEDASPIGAIIEGITLAALAFTFLWQNCTTFRNIVKAAFADVLAFGNALWSGLKAVFSDISSAFVDVYDGFKKVGDDIGSFFTGVGNAVKQPFEDAFNFVADAWNDTVGSLSFHIPSWVPGIGGDGFSMPKIPTFAAGGLMNSTGMAWVGENGPELVQLPGGSHVTPAAQSAGMSGGGTIVVQVGNETIAKITDQRISVNAAKTRTAVTQGRKRL